MAFQTKMIHRNILWTVRLFILSWSVSSFLMNTARGQDAPHCSSTFHVWQPGHEAQQMMREMFLKMDNLTSYTKYEIATMKVHMAEEANRLQNWTYSVDKRVFQIQIDKMDDELLQMKLSSGSSNVQMQLKHISSRVDELEKSMSYIRSKLRSGRSSVDVAGESNSHYNIPQQQGLSEDVGASLKNSIGDLKAEWILLKREIESLKKENINHLELQEVMQNSTANLKVVLNKTKLETKAVEMKVYGIADKQDRLEVKMERVLAECEQINFLLDKYKADLHQYGANVEALQSTSVSLRNELSDVHIKLATMRDNAWSHQKLRDGTPPESLIIPQRAPEHSQNFERYLAENSKERVFISSMEEFSSESLRDCHDIYLAGFKVSSVYHIQLDGARTAVSVYCEMINNTGYTIIQRRIDGTLSFNRRWSEYQQGFGNPYGELWAGNEWIHLLTKQKQYTLRIDFWDWEGGQFYAEYARFYVESENEQYRLTVSEYTGNAGDSFSYHNKMAFSTEDMDNDLHERHCAAENKAGWWYNSCFYSQLNGIYHTAWYSSQSKYADGIVWFTLKDDEFYSLKKVEMKLKPNKAMG